jgi:hypothetical protein
MVRPASRPARFRAAVRRSRGRQLVDIFDEVEEDLRADRAKLLLKQYGPWLVAAAVVVVAAVAAWRAWQWYEAQQTAAVAESYIAAMKASDTQKGTGRLDAVPAFLSIAEKAGPGYRTLARLHAAALKADSGDLAGAGALWDAVAADSSADPLLRDLANLQWALHQIDTGDPAAVEARLQPLAAPTNPWRSLAQEGLAMLDLRRGMTAKAREALKSLAQDITAPEGVRRRADGLLERLGS